MKVYGIYYYGNTRRIVAAKSKKEAAALIGVSYSHMREFGCQTYNDEEIALAMQVPGKVWEKVGRWDGEWREVGG